MATRITTLGVVTKWIGVPVALALVGRFIIGPLLLPKMPASIRKPADEALTSLQAKVKTFGGSTTTAPATSEVKPESVPEKTAPAKAPVKMESSTSENSSQSSDHPPVDADQSGGPEVEVSVRSDRPIETHRVRKPKRKSVHKKPKPTPKTDTNDPGSFGGTQDPPTTTGGTTDPPTGN